MHEYGFAAKMLAEVRKLAKKNGLKKLLAVKIEYSDDHADERTMKTILSDLARGSELENTEFKIKRIAGEQPLFRIREMKHP